MIYLASPFSSMIPNIQEERTRRVRSLTFRLLDAGYQVFSPIAYGHAVEAGANGQLAYEAWMTFDLAMLGRCDELWVATIPGWDASGGVKREIQEATRLGKRIRFVSEEGEVVSSSWLAMLSKCALASELGEMLRGGQFNINDSEISLGMVANG